MALCLVAFCLAMSAPIYETLLLHQKTKWDELGGHAMKSTRASVRNKLSRTAMLGCSALSIAVALQSAPAYAQDNDAIEEVIVTGIRGSLQRAIDVKRNSDAIVDAIATEDLGKFPDSNVAESLQRISGVSIDRSGGEGQFVTVRGFGPEFNTVLVNGRRIATENPGREFSFDILAAELISGAEIYKSSPSTLQEGGIGSTINISQARPFDFDDFKAVVSAKGVYETLSEEVAPQAFGFFTDTFADDRFGVLFSASYQKRKARFDSAESRGYNTSDLPQAGLSNVFIPQNYNQFVTTEDRERIGFTGVVQFQATDDLVLTADAIYSKFDVESRSNGIGHWFSPDQVLSADIDENRTVTRLDHSANGATDFITRVLDRPTKTWAAGFNAEWTPTDQIKTVFDASWSRATRSGGDQNSFTVIGFNNDYSYANDGTEIPSITGFDSLNGAPVDILDPSLARAHFVINGAPGDLNGFEDVTDEIYEIKIDNEWNTDYEHFTALKFGAIYSEQVKKNQVFQSDPATRCLYCGYGVDVDDGLLSVFNAGSDFLSGTGGSIPRAWLTFDPDAYFNFLATNQAAQLAADAARNDPPGTTAAILASTNGFARQLQPDSFNVNEEIFAAYAQADFEWEIGGLPWHANVGVRYVHTNVEARGRTLTLSDLVIIPNDETDLDEVFDGGVQDISQTNNYDKLLPSLTAWVDVRDDLIVRFAASKSLTRPQLTQLAPRVTIDVSRPGNLLASGGNPDLQPFTSDNFDLSVEWYFKEASFLTVGLFYKNVEDFVVNLVADEAFSIANSDNIPEFAGGEAIFSVRRPRNVEEARVRGLELSGQFTFDMLPAPFDGLGITGNATFVTSNAEVDTGDTTIDFGLEGLGNSQNLILFYEKGPIEARIAYNRRAEFLQTLSVPVGGGPEFVDTFEQIDVRASYTLFENYSIFFEGINVTGEETRRHGRFDNHFTGLQDTGARYSIGVRAQF